MTKSLVAFGLGIVVLVGCERERGPQRDSEQRPSNDTPVNAEATGETASIGVARMEDDGTIVLTLRAEGEGVVGDAQFSYTQDVAQYQGILKHLGGLKKGETKPVPPWPDRNAAAGERRGGTDAPRRGGKQGVPPVPPPPPPPEARKPREHE